MFHSKLVDLKTRLYYFMDQSLVSRDIFNNTENVCSVKPTDIPKVVFTPHHVGQCCTKVIQGYCCAIMR